MIPSAPLKKAALELGFDTVGVCAPDPPPHIDAYTAWLGKGYHGTMEYLQRHLTLKQNPSQLLPGVQSVVAVTLNYNQPNSERRVARYALGRDYHKVLRAKLRKLALWVEIQQPNAECRPCVDSAPIMERDYAQLAGLGWFGKNTLLIDSRRGSWFFIGLLLTTAEFQRDPPATGSCGTCTACIEACPTGALVHEDDRWQLDARRCISYLTIENKGAIDFPTAGWVFGCDVCQEVCPFNDPRPSQPLRGRPTTQPDFVQKRSWPKLERLRLITDAEWEEISRGSATRRATAQMIRRNASAAE